MSLLTPAWEQISESNKRSFLPPPAERRRPRWVAKTLAIFVVLYALQALGEVRQVARILEQQVETLGAINLGELVDDLLQPSRQRAAHDAGRSGLSIGTRTALPHSTHEPS